MDKKKDTKYKDPENMINIDGTKEYAYITFIIGEDKYLPGAIVLAESIRKLGSLADLVVIITTQITKDGIKILKRFYDHVIILDYVDLYLIKLHTLTLVQYKKIIVITPDAIILKCPNHLFTFKNSFLLKTLNYLYNNIQL